MASGSRKPAHSKSKSRNTNQGGGSAKVLKTAMIVLILGAVAVAAIAVVLVSSSNGGNHSNQQAAQSTTTTTGPQVAPLTGLPPSSASIMQRPAIDMKIDDDSLARPQSGVNQADVVYEEVVEGGITRWLAVFQSQSAAKVGPVRSVRQTDADIVAPIGGLFAYSGGIPAFINDVMSTGVKDVGFATGDPSAYYRDNTRLIPDNLYTSTSQLWQDNSSDTTPPAPIFHYRTLGVSFSAQGATPVGIINLAMSGTSAVSWQWNASQGDWTRSQGSAAVDSSGNPISFTNVIVELVPYHNTGFVDPAGNPVPDADTIGTGPALVLSGGEVARATWNKPSQKSKTAYLDSRGNVIQLAPGNTWVELLPSSQPAPQCSGGNGVAIALCQTLSSPPTSTTSTGGASGVNG